MNKQLTIKISLTVVVLVYLILNVFKSDVADGFDGYYYVMQIDTFISSGEFHSRDFSLIYLPLVLLSLILSPLMAYKLTVMVIGTLFVYACFKYINGRNRKFPTVLLILFIVGSPTFLFFLLQFPKNMMGLALLLLFIVSYNKKLKLQTVILFILTIFAHRLAITMVIGYLVFQIIFSKVNRKIILLFVGIFVIGLFIPGLVNILDYQRVISSSITPLTYWGSVSFFNLWDLWKNPSWLSEFILIHLLLIYLLLKTKKLNPLLIMAILLLCPIFRFESGSLAYRLFLNGYLLVPIISFSYIQDIKLKKVVTILLIISIPLSFMSKYNYSKFNPPISVYKNISHQLGKIDKEIDIMIAHKGLKEQIILNTDYDALNWIPNKVTNNTYRIFTNIPDYYILKYIEDEDAKSLTPLPYGYYLVKENIFIEMMNKMKQNETKDTIRKIETWQNPSRKKPGYL